jgi:NtrC-family two-component system response regulator AlgB
VPRVLVIDDEKNIRATLTVCLESMGATAVAVSTAAAAEAELARAHFDIAFVDLRLGAESGLELIPRLLGAAPALAIVVMTAYATYDTAVEAVRRGASDYVPKPFTPAQIRHIVERLSERRALEARVQALEETLAGVAPEVDLASASPRMHAVLDTIERAAAADAAVLLRGENGTGKGVAARLLHAKSPRHDRPFVTVNCPTLSEELLASELFGHVRGSFTGAVRDQEGRVESAEGGTLFLDEIGEIPPGLQAKLLRFLQDHEFERLGDNRTRRADVRVVAATNRDLEADVKAGRFREDLFFRLGVIEVRLPALRERAEDILPLARRFLAFFAAQSKRALPELSRAAEAMLQGYAWPGNLRELRNAVERAVILWPAQLLEVGAFPERMTAGAGAASVPATGGAEGAMLGGDFSLDAIEREHIMRVIARTATLDEAAAVLGIDASTLWRKRKKYETEKV